MSFSAIDPLARPHMPTYADLRASGREPRLHGNGFAQIDVSKDARLHVWSPALPPAQAVRTPIHDHTFDFRSHLLTGFVVHTVYRQAPGEGHRIYVPVPNVGHDTRLVPADEPSCDLHPCSRLEVWDGWYDFGAGIFHTTDSRGEAATLMVKTRLGVTPRARVACPAHLEPDNAFNRHEVDLDAVWEAIRGAMARAGLA